MPLSVIVDWFGAYGSPGEAVRALEGPLGGEFGAAPYRGLYMALGQGNVCRYVGKSQNLVNRLKAPHETVKRSDKLYVGRVCSPGVSGPRSTYTPKDHLMAERALIFVLQPTRNTYGLKNPPSDCVVVFSRLFDPADPTSPAEFPLKFPVLAAYDPAAGHTLLLKGSALQ